MRKNLGWVLASVVSLGIAGIGAASAADMAAKARPFVADPGYNWSGFYVGGNAGWEDTHTSWTSFDTAPEAVSARRSGGTAGGQVGVLGQWGSFVAGLEVSYNGLFGGSATGGNVLFPNQFGEAKINDLLLVTGRVGWAWNQNLIYAKGGWANSDVKLNFLAGVPPVTTGTTSGRENGWTVGAGWEYGFAPSWSVALEYDFAHLNIGDRRYSIIPTAVCVNPACGTTAAGSDIQMVTARLNYHFNWGGPVVARY
jgi:outer membrane immunogenic protein